MSRQMNIDASGIILLHSKPILIDYFTNLNFSISNFFPIANGYAGRGGARGGRGRGAGRGGANPRSNGGTYLGGDRPRRENGGGRPFDKHSQTGHKCVFFSFSRKTYLCLLYD